MSQIPPYPPYPHQPQTASSSTPIPLQPATATANSVPPLPPLPHGLIEYTESDDQVYKTRYFALKHLVQAVEDENNMLAYKLAQLTARIQRTEFDRIMAIERGKRQSQSQSAIPPGSHSKFTTARSREKSQVSVSAIQGDTLGHEDMEGSRRGSLTGIERVNGEAELENGKNALGSEKETKKSSRKSTGAPRKSRTKAQPIPPTEESGSTINAENGSHPSAGPAAEPSPQIGGEPAPSSPAALPEVGEDEDELMDDY